MRTLDTVAAIQDPGWCYMCMNTARAVRIDTHDGYYAICETCLGRLLRFVRSNGRSNPRIGR